MTASIALRLTLGLVASLNCQIASAGPNDGLPLGPITDDREPILCETTQMQVERYCEDSTQFDYRCCEYHPFLEAVNTGCRWVTWRQWGDSPYYALVERTFVEKCDLMRLRRRCPPLVLGQRNLPCSITPELKAHPGSHSHEPVHHPHHPHVPEPEIEPPIPIPPVPAGR